MMPLRYHWSSAELPAAEYSTSAIGPVRSGGITVLRDCLMWLRIVSETSKKYRSMPMFGAGSVSRPWFLYAPGAHMK
jgi:hypothetical protein